MQDMKGWHQHHICPKHIINDGTLNILPFWKTSHQTNKQKKRKVFWNKSSISTLLWGGSVMQDMKGWHHRYMLQSHIISIGTLIFLPLRNTSHQTNKQKKSRLEQIINFYSTVVWFSHAGHERMTSALHALKPYHHLWFIYFSSFQEYFPTNKQTKDKCSGTNYQFLFYCGMVESFRSWKDDISITCFKAISSLMGHLFFFL